MIDRDAEDEGFLALEYLHVGVLLVRRDLSIVLANRRARRIMARADGLAVDEHLVGPRLRTTDARDEQGLLEAVECALRDLEDGRPAHVPLMIRRGRGRRSLAAVVKAMRLPARGAAERAVAAVFVSDPEQEVETGSGDEAYGEK